jgi:competence protein ComEC
VPGARFVPLAAVAGLAIGILVAEEAPGLAPLPGVAAAASAAACLAGIAGVAGGARAAAALVLVAVALGGISVGAWRADDTSLATGPGSVAALAGQDLRIAGAVADDPRPRADRQQLVIDEVAVVNAEVERPLRGRVLVWLPRGIGVSVGDRIALDGRLEQPRDFDGFAYRDYLARQGIGVILRAYAAVPAGGAGGPAALLADLRGWLRDGLNAIVPEPEAALGAGILLGVRSAIAPEINEAFATAGLTHIVAISGWNIAIVAALVASMTRPLARRPGGRWTTPVAGIGAVGAYVLLTGAGPSVVRAALMALALVVARSGGSPTHAASALLAAAGVMLAAAPPVLWDVGFQLSLLATGGLIAFAGGFERALHRWPGWLREPVALTMAAQLTTLPIILLNFERLSIVAPLANVLVVPIVPLAMVAAAVAAPVGAVVGALHIPLISDAVAWLVGGCAWLSLRAMILVGSAVASLPLAAVDFVAPGWLPAAWYPALGIGRWALAPSPEAAETGPVRPVEMGRSRPRLAIASAAGRAASRLARPSVAALATVAALVALSAAGRPDGRLHVTVLDIGQGDAILVEAPSGATMLVDGGPDPELTLRRLGAELPFFARRIDVVVLTHPHQDHVGGLTSVIERFRVRLVFHAGIPYQNPAYPAMLAAAEREPGASVSLARAGQRLQLDDTTSVEVLYPTDQDARSPLSEGDINNGSIVMVLRYGSFSALLTGDAEAPVEASLLSRGLVPDVDLLKVGHHGSRSSTTAAFLAAAAPSVAVISSGGGNEYGHPAPETLATLATAPGVVTYRTDTDGSVEVVTDGRSLTVRTRDGVTAPQPTDDAGSIGPWPSPISTSHAECSPASSCPMGSSPIPRAFGGSRWLPPDWWSRPASRWMAGWSRRPRCSTTSTRSRSGASAASMASSARSGLRRWATRSLLCPSPPIRSMRSSTRTAFRVGGSRCWSPSRTGTSRRSSSRSTSGSTT